MIKISQALILLVALLHIGFFILERFIWTTATGLKIFKMTKEAALHSQNLASNQGFYNLLLSLGLIWTLIASTHASSKAIQIFILIFIIACGIYGTITVGKNIFFLQTLPALLALLSVIAVLAHPRINDISTDLDHVILFQSIENKTIDPSFAQSQKKHYPEVSPLTLHASKNDVYQKVVELIKNKKNWKITLLDPNAFQIEAETYTPLVKFTDDVAIKIDEQNRLTTVNMRSKSRLGKSDFGANAKRINEFLTELSHSMR